MSLLSMAGCGRREPLPNILFITLDTTRADRLGCYGYADAETPALDALAEEGALFERAYSTVPITLPSHASMMTGLYPPEHGLRINGAASLSGGVPTVAEVFAGAGYRTGAFVAAFVLDGKFGLQRGFETYDDNLAGAEEVAQELHRYRNGRLVTDAALAWLDREDSRPFFAWIHLYDPHAPYHPHQDLFRDRFVDQPYDAEIAFDDRQIQRLLDHLSAAGVRERTLVVVVGDHGEGLDDHGENRHGYMLYDTTLRVPFLVSWPGHVPGGVRISDPVSIVNLPATLLDLAGLEVPSAFARGSLAGALEGGAVPIPLYYAETDGPFLEHGWCPQRAVVTREWKYIRSTKPELYHLVSDPGERTNRVAALPDRAQDMDDRLYELETTMRISEAATAHLSDQERRVLESLGYAGRRAEADPATGETLLPDIKDKIGLINQNTKAREWIQSGRPEEGIALLRATAEADPENPMFVWELGRGLYALERYEEAAEAYEEFLERRPDSVGALNQLGMTHHRLGAMETAETYYRRSLALEPDDSHTRSNLAMLLLEAGRLTEANETATQALEQDPDSLDLRQNLALVLEKQERLPEALALWREILEREPLHESAAMQMERIRERLQATAKDGPQESEESPPPGPRQ